MSEHEFDVKLRQIDEQYQARREGAEAFRDQELARLFYGSEWVQQRIAERMGKAQSWVSQRLKFGAFLEFITNGDSRAPTANLTERRFRAHWNRTKGSERERFAAVLHAIENGIPQGYAALLDKPKVRAAILDCLADGQWYTVEQITATCEEKLVGLTVAQVSSALLGLRNVPPRSLGGVIEARPLGRNAQYRLAKSKRGAAQESDLLALYEKARPLIDELHEWGRTDMHLQVPSQLAIIAAKLDRLFDAFLAKEKTRSP